jgi:branched-chain amino acid transport system permease protein
MIETLLSGCSTVGIQMILAMSVNIFSGYVRQLTFGHAAFAACGAYTSALLSLRAGFSFWIACPLSILVTSGIGLLVALPCLRSPKHYLMVMTFMMSFGVQYLLRNGRFAGGYVGLGHIAPPNILGMTLEAKTYWPLVIVALGLCGVVHYRFQSSRYGCALGDCRVEGGEQMSSVARRAVLLAFVVSTAMAGLGGSLFAHYKAFIRPLDFDLEASLFILAMVIAGGLGSVTGTLLAAALLSGLFELIQPWAEYRLLAAGMVFLLVGLWFPDGFMRPSAARISRFFSNLVHG